MALSLTTVLALGAQAASLEERVKALEEQNTVLTEEVLASQSNGFTLVDTQKSYSGLGAVASKVYFSKNPLSIGGMVKCTMPIQTMVMISPMFIGL